MGIVILVQPLVVLILSLCLKALESTCVARHRHPWSLDLQADGSSCR